jgi:hypothetical protein
MILDLRLAWDFGFVIWVIHFGRLDIGALCVYRSLQKKLRAMLREPAEHAGSCIYV